MDVVGLVSIKINSSELQIMVYQSSSRITRSGGQHVSHFEFCLHTRAMHPRFFFSDLFYLKPSALRLQINEPSVFLRWCSEFRDPVGNTQPKDLRFGQDPIAILVWYILHQLVGDVRILEHDHVND